ncbi:MULTISPECIES: helix-turn-helix domain-containing protein [Geobacillus]|jgi:two-component system, response regulator YesN|uniref:helix-turn-helix domain-containing protein n=2 Tax=Anoxybacillaceae TaxID=3120669 RepID=UPI000406A201|nr:MULTISPECIES: helix-turn-helix domain-containing protein [Geobacillus]ARA97033.1 DNA-binding response regulator [Geobacillus thermodenitrificans]ARP42354.1 HTH-type transcriptional activator Btr [Geobacillus thermodenitrificans]KQB93749.1 AraC family transcriptional regulator [Geobacillus sp. PA-3]MED4916302.1 helix-turn-helix domain-containing protein [Geobacillus thermodenitrificans]PTR48491.1 DNA-binding response regulator [Geobacillus thermodenitrificans]
MKLVIAERDHNEREAIRWLVSAYSLPIEQVYTAATVEEMMALLEREAPELLYVELDMIPYEQWGKATSCIRLFCQRVIAVTAEATFARAKQAIDLQCVDLLVKPLEPAKLKQALRTAASLSAGGERPRLDAHFDDYRPLFYEDFADVSFHVWLVQAEQPSLSAEVVRFLTSYPFRRRARVLPLTHMAVCLFPELPGNGKEEAWKMMRDWEEEHHEPLAVVIMPPDGQQSVRMRYQAARRLLETTFFIGYQQVIAPAPEYERWRELDPFLTPEEQRQWVEMLEQFDHEAVKRWLQNEFSHWTPPFPSPEMVRTRLTSILAQIRRFMKTYRLDHGTMECEYMRLFQDILYNPVLYRIVQELILFLYRLLHEARRAEEGARVDAIERGLRYMETHFRDPSLTLERTAAAAGRSPAYFSHLLSTKRGVTFRQWLTKRRLEEAKRLLRQTDLSVKEIAEQTGFRTAHYLTRVFKAELNRTPTAYRDEQRLHRSSPQ